MVRIPIHERLSVNIEIFEKLALHRWGIFFSTILKFASLQIAPRRYFVPKTHLLGSVIGFGAVSLH